MPMTANKLTIVMFGIAAGGYREEIENYMAIHGEQETAAVLLRNSGLDRSSDEDFVNIIVSRLTTWLPPDVYSDTVKLILDYMRYEHPERSRAELVVDLINAIESKPSTDPVYGQAADWFRYKVYLADLYKGTSTDFNNVLYPIVENFDPRIPFLAQDFVPGVDVLYKLNLTNDRMKKISGEYVIDKAGPRDSVTIQKDNIFYITTDGLAPILKEGSGLTTPSLTIDGERYVGSGDFLPSWIAPDLTNLAAYLDERFVGTTTPGDEALIVINYVLPVSTTSFVYEYKTNAAALNDIAPDELELVGIINRGDTLMQPGDII